MSEQRIAVTARLRPGSRERAEELLAQGPPYELGAVELEWHAAFVSSDLVVLVFAGPNVERVVGDLVNDPVVSASFSAWAPLLDGVPQLAHERFFWHA